MSETYSPGREKQLRILLLVAALMAGLMTAYAGFLVATGYLLLAAYLAIPSAAVLVASLLALRLVPGGGRPAKVLPVVTGVLLVLVGLLLARAAVGLLPSVVGVLLILLALLRDIGDR